MSIIYRPYQLDAIQATADALAAHVNTLVIAPTGSGKSYMQAETLRTIPGGALLTPSVEIARGIAVKLGYTGKNPESVQIYTPMRFLNLLKKANGHGNPFKLIRYLLIDESHHDAANTYQEIYQRCQIPRVGFTATPYRINARQTEAFLKNWQRQTCVLTWKDAVEQGYLSFPDIRTIPLIDDDTLNVTNGDIDIKQLENATHSIYDALYAALNAEGITPPRRPTIMAFPGVRTCGEFVEYGNRRGNYNFEMLTGESTDKERKASIARMIASYSILAQINILGEGVDFPVRHLIDVSPTLSPVRFVQRLGRVMRPVKPGESPPVYLCFNRNVQHHGYLLADVLPPSAIAESIEAFGGLSQRCTNRVAGIETFGRIKPSEVRCKDGTFVHLYMVNGLDYQDCKFQYAVVISPIQAEPFWFNRELPDGKWQTTTKPENFTATGSASKYLLSPNQVAWWQKSARAFGLDETQEIDSRSFQLLPILANTRMRLA